MIATSVFDDGLTRPAVPLTLKSKAAPCMSPGPVFLARFALTLQAPSRVEHSLSIPSRIPARSTDRGVDRDACKYFFRVIDSPSAPIDALNC